jgi:signal peptidase II
MLRILSTNLSRKHWVSIALLIVFFDQLSKFYSSVYLSPFSRLEVLPGIDLVLRYNSGAAFSFLADASGWQRWFFISLALIVSISIYHCLSKVSSEKPLESLGFTCLLGGAIGNLIDRVLHGQVTDFILLYYRQWEWPAFNIADTAICIGMTLLLPMLFQRKV